MYFDSRYDYAYWDHSFVEISKYDLPAFIEYIKKYTSDTRMGDKITLVAHSQGTTETFYGFIKEPEYYKENIYSFIAVSPVAKVTKVTPLN